MEEKAKIINNVYNAVAKEYKNLDKLCKTIQDSYNNDTKLELSHEDILPLLNVLDTFNGMNLYED